MKCKRQPRFLENRPVQIRELWEVHLSVETWQQIRTISRKRKTSCSALVRYCVFRLISAENLRWNALYEKAHRAGSGRGTHYHRHLLCLYGEDVVQLRLAAMQLRITVSALVRLALKLYLPRLAMEIHSRKYVSDEKLFWHGTKFWQKIHFRALHHNRQPMITQQLFQSFLPWHWWPPGQISLRAA